VGQRPTPLPSRSGDAEARAGSLINTVPDLESLFLLTRESMLKSGLYAYHDHLQATSKFYLAAVVLSDPVLEVVRRELRRLSDAKLEIDELREALQLGVVKREVIEGEKADAARKKVSKAAGKMLRIAKEREDPGAAERSPVVDISSDINQPKV
jgi:hypothetical protein